MKFPLSDDYMIFNYDTMRYELTSKDIFENLGIDFDSEGYDKTVVRAYLKLASLKVYNYIHSHNCDDDYQDYVIAKTKKGRKLIKEALEMQVLLYASTGNLAVLPDKEARALSIADEVKDILLRPIPEIGCSILYTGYIPRVNLGAIVNEKV